MRKTTEPGVLAALAGCMAILAAAPASPQQPTLPYEGPEVLLLASALAASVTTEAGVDTAIQPGDDFFAFANGEWLGASAIPAGKDRWTARNEIDVRAHLQIANLIDTAAGAPPGSDARKVADFRAAYLNEAAIEARGLEPLKPQFERIALIQDKAALVRMLGRELRADVDPLNRGVYDSAHLLGLAVEEGNHGEKAHVAYLLQGGLGLPDRDQYLGTAPEPQARREAYRQYIGRQFALAGFDRAAQRAEAVMALETAIAQTHATREASASERNADNLWTRADFAREAPGMDWRAFFAAAGLSKQETFVVWQPGAIKGAASLSVSQPLEAWKDYLRLRIIDSRADVLPREFARIGEQRPRSQRALDATNQALGEALGRVYVEKFFPAEYKTRLQAINTNVVAAFRKRVEAVTWMSPATRAEALAKLDALYVGLGYPEKWPDHSGLRIDAADAFGNLQRIAEWNYRNALERLGQPVDTAEWRITPHTVGAVLIFQQNAYNFSAALLQPPKFGATASDAANYGAIGAILAHDISHFVDSLGAEYGADGAARRWWTAEDLAHYQLAVDPLVQQFSAYRPLPDLAVDGKLTLIENLADLGGLVAAFDAHRRALGAKVSDKQFVRQQDRQFFIGFARAWRSKSSGDALRTQLTTDGHAPESFRVATVRNIDAWYEAFDVRPGQRLYLSPEARVRIW